jgi:hypothetical protein
MMEGIKMKEKGQSPGRWAYAIPVLVLFLGLILSAWILIVAGFWKYPAMIEKAFSEEQHQLNVPGAKDVTLTRTGAYGIYYVYDLRAYRVARYQVPPAMDCSLTSKSTGAVIQAVPEYIKTNRYGDKNQDRMGVLIMSLTVEKPDDYTFACRYQDDMHGLETTVALGPNYAWEVLKVMGKIGLPLLGGAITICGSVLLALLMIIVVAIKRHVSQGQQPG